MFLLAAGTIYGQQPVAAKIVRKNPPPLDEVRIVATTQESAGNLVKLRGNAIIETTEMLLQADEVDWNRETGDAEARGNVKFTHFQRAETLTASHIEYNTESETGKFYDVQGQTQAKIESKPGLLTTADPFSFTCKWAERLEDRYVCHQGVVTNCKLPNPWWTLRGPVFDIIPEDRAIARNSWFRLRGVPLFYTPYFYKSLKRVPRKSGFLTPNIGNSSRRGFMLGGGYYWAINRSYDATYRAQLFTSRGVAHNIDFRGKPTQTSDFNFLLYGVNDRGRPDNRTIKEGGYLMSADGRWRLPDDWNVRVDFNYLSSFKFRQAFTESFYEAIYSQVQSIAYIKKNWSTFYFTGLYQSNDNFLSADPRDRISLRKLPAAEFGSRDHQLGELPVWFSFDSSFSLMRRNQLAFQTRRFVDRGDFQPRITTTFHWKDFHVTPTFSVEATHYGSTFDTTGTAVIGNGAWRFSKQADIDFRTPVLERVFDTKGWLGPKLKHVIEPRARYRYITGVDDSNRYIRFDELELLTNTNQIEYGITNRLLARRKDGRIDDVLSWDLVQQRYFNPSFGDTIVSGKRNINLTTADLTAFAFLDQVRGYSPIVSTLRLQPIWTIGLEWRSDFDPKLSRITNSTLQANARVEKWSFSIGHNQLNVPWAKANQATSMIGYGQENRKGFSTAFMAVYDYRVETLILANVQLTYNTDCCGFSAQVRRWNFGARQENQFRVALAIANIGSFGTLRRQERIY